jgi:hypothetical protein
MNEPVAPQRTRPSLRRLLATALSGGLGVFALATDATPATKPTTPTPPSSITTVDQPEA